MTPNVAIKDTGMAVAAMSVLRLEKARARVAVLEAWRECPRCRREKEPEEFSRGCAYCRSCESERVTALDARRVTLEGERARLESEIRDASAIGTLGAAVEHRLGMHVPTDKQVVILQRTRQDETP